MNHKGPYATRPTDRTACTAWSVADWLGPWSALPTHRHTTRPTNEERRYPHFHYTTYQYYFLKQTENPVLDQCLMLTHPVNLNRIAAVKAQSRK